MKPLALLSFALLLGALQSAVADTPEAAPKPPQAAASAPAHAHRRGHRPPVDQKKPAPDAKLDRVLVEGMSDEQARRNSTAAKIIIGREEIERYGDTTLGETLKRLPGITTGGRPGRGGEVRMRGMGSGYTQILVNGERMPPGFQLDQLTPDQVERIEILRAPTAEYGARAIAGTINIVLREALQKRMNEWRLAMSEEHGSLRPNISWTRNDKLDDHGGAYNLTVNAFRNEHNDDVQSTALTQLLGTTEQSLVTNHGHNNAANSGLHVVGRLQWRLGQGDSLSIQPFIVLSQGKSGNVFDQTQDYCDPDPTSQLRCLDFDHANTDSQSHSAMLRLHGQWIHKIDADSRVEVHTALGEMDTYSHSFRTEYLDGVTSRTQEDTIDSEHHSLSFTGKYSHTLFGDHSLVTGFEAENQRLDQTRVTLQDGLPRSQLDDFGDDLDASTLRTATYVQDEWTVGKQWAFYAGLREEAIATHSAAASTIVNNKSSVWTPLLHALWKFDPNSRDQIRASLTRSYRSPNLSDLVALPSINSQYPCPDNALCGANVVNNPDHIGNPNLQPELARGLELAYEDYPSLGGVISANFFYRRIQNLIRTETELETVSWADVQRWVARPRNIGSAQTDGVELEAKFRLDQYFTGAWPINLRSNLSLFHSHVDQIQGPYNTLDQQPHYVGNLGFDYHLAKLPLMIGANFNYTPVTSIQETTLQLNTSSQKRVIDAYGLWTFNPAWALRVSATNLLPLNYFTGSVITTNQALITSNSGGRSFVIWGLRLEIKA